MLTRTPLSLTTLAVFSATLVLSTSSACVDESEELGPVDAELDAAEVGSEHELNLEATLLESEGEPAMTLGEGSSELLGPVDQPDQSESSTDTVFVACLSQCTSSEMIIGCDDRVQGNTQQSATAGPYDMIGQFEHQDGGGDCTGTLIGDKFVLGAAHCFIDGSGQFKDEPTGFSLSQSWSSEPYGKIYAKRVFVPTAYGTSQSAENKAFDYALVELAHSPNAPRTMDFGHLSWGTLSGRTTVAVGYPYDKAEGTAWYDHGSFAASQPYKSFDDGESGILRVSNDGVGGMSGGPLYVWYGGARKLVGVFIGSPEAECEAGHVWAARMTPEAVERIENAMLYPPNGNVIDFSWDVHEFSSVPATE